MLQLPLTKEHTYANLRRWRTEFASAACAGGSLFRLAAPKGLSGCGSGHLLRHTGATLMLEGGSDVRYVQQLLGHESLDTTALYAQVTTSRLIEVQARYHPGAKLEAALAAPTPSA